MNKRHAIKPASKRAPRKNRKKKMPRTWGQRLGVLKRPGMVLAGIGLLVLVSAGFVAGYQLITRNECLQVTHIDVQGAHMLTPDELLQKAGIRYGDNIMAINLSLVRRKLMAEPWILDAEVSRALPSNLSIRVKERSPLAVVDFGECYFVGQDGRIFKKLDRSVETVDLPIIKGLSYTDIDAEGYATGKAFCAAIEALKTSGRVSHLMDGMKIKTLVVDRDTGVRLDGLMSVGCVRIGYDNYFYKFRRLKEVLWRSHKENRQQDIAAVGLENPDRVIVKMTEQDTTQKGGEHAGTGYRRRS
ncbi:MAG: FtsQ-type POTRA domain-containing protein [Thermodesulfobacteriota bacterium]|nr:FtsQ-type POTRA domain-containing protein [Thermodesulfobacteriota bacterium]